jgi:hypothetical protein
MFNQFNLTAAILILFNFSSWATDSSFPDYCPTSQQIEGQSQFIYKARVGDSLEVGKDKFTLIELTRKESSTEEFYIIPIEPPSNTTGCFYEMKTVVTDPYIVTFGLRLSSPQ